MSLTWLFLYKSCGFKTFGMNFITGMQFVCLTVVTIFFVSLDNFSLFISSLDYNLFFFSPCLCSWSWLLDWSCWFLCHITGDQIEDVNARALGKVFLNFVCRGDCKVVDNHQMVFAIIMLFQMFMIVPQYIFFHLFLFEFFAWGVQQLVSHCNCAYMLWFYDSYICSHAELIKI